MADPNSVIVVEHLKKDFILPHEQINTVKGLFTNLFRRRRGKETQHALRDISFEIKEGEFFGIVGRNGSGKSTLLKILASIYQPTSGTAGVRGKLVPFIELGVGFNPELTGRENVYLNGALLGFSNREVDAMYQDIVSFAELERFMDQKLKNYSSGMQVRLAFSMAIRAQADILLIDEVLAVGDADFQRKCFDYFKTLKKEKRTVVFVSHDMAAVREFCDRAVLIENGKIMAEGDTARVTDEYSSLFLKESHAQDTKTKTVRRLGEGRAVIEEVKVNKKTLGHFDDEVNFEVAIKSVEPHGPLVTGYAVRDAAGNYLNGTNTLEVHEKLPKLQPGDTLIVTWTMPNIYEDGKYTINVNIYGDDNSMYDSIEEAVSFQVKRLMRSPFLVAPSQKVKSVQVKKKQD